MDNETQDTCLVEPRPSNLVDVTTAVEFVRLYVCYALTLARKLHQVHIELLNFVLSYYDV